VGCTFASIFQTLMDRYGYRISGNMDTSKASTFETYVCNDLIPGLLSGALHIVIAL
jgi:hypothetical protein